MSERTPWELLATGVDSFAGNLQADGTLHDPVFDTPTQYGSSYYGWCCAVLAAQTADGSFLGGSGTEVYRERAARILSATLAHTADPELPPHASGFNRQTLGVTSRFTHRDFTWPPNPQDLHSARRGPAGAGADRRADRIRRGHVVVPVVAAVQLGRRVDERGVAADAGGAVPDATGAVRRLAGRVLRAERHGRIRPRPRHVPGARPSQRLRPVHPGAPDRSAEQRLRRP